jgi:hypothetical protein
MESGSFAEVLGVVQFAMKVVRSGHSVGHIVDSQKLDGLSPRRLKAVILRAHAAGLKALP